MIWRNSVHKIRSRLQLISHSHFKLKAIASRLVDALEIRHVGCLFLNGNVAMSRDVALSLQELLEGLHGVLEWFFEVKALEAPLVVNHLIEPDLLIQITAHLNRSFAFVLQDKLVKARSFGFAWLISIEFLGC